MTDAVRGYIKNISSVFGTDAINEADRTVSGYFTDDNIDEHGHVIDKAAMQSAIDEYRQWANIRDMHGSPVGTAVSIGEKSWNHVVAKIASDEVWGLISAGVYKGFSIGAIVTSGKMVSVKEFAEDKFFGVSSAMKKAIKRLGEVFVITELSLIEISVVDRPANPRAVYSKSLDELGGVVALPDVVGISKSESIRNSLTRASISGTENDDTDETVQKVNEMEVTMVNEEVVANLVNSDAQVETDVVDTIVIEDTIVVEDEVVEPVVVEIKEANVSVEPADNIVEVVPGSFATTVADLEKSLSALSELVAKLLDAVEEAKSAQPKEEVSSRVVINDENIEKLAGLVADKMATARRSAVYGRETDEDEIPKRVDIKSLKTEGLSQLIVSSIANRSKNK